MITGEIAGYSFDTENKCVDCIRAWAIAELIKEGHGPSGGGLGKTTESLLDLLAGIWDIERSYTDSEDFPVPFSDQQAETDRGWALHDGVSPSTCDTPNCGESFGERDF
jgi:hypothetical protein